MNHYHCARTTTLRVWRALSTKTKNSLASEVVIPGSTTPLPQPLKDEDITHNAAGTSTQEAEHSSLFPPEIEAQREWVDMWNKKGPAGPEWGGPREYEPTRYGDWARKGRVSDF